MNHHPIPATHFSKRTLRALAAMGIFIISAQAVPAFSGDTYFQGTAYMLTNGQMRSFLEVIAIAEGGAK